MRFALLGDHPDGLDMARALAESGRHELLVYSGPAVGAEYLRRWGLRPRLVGDLEEVLADPAVDAVLVAGAPGDRPAQLRRALQSERHALCVHPAGPGPDIAYEAGMIQTDTGHLAMPLLPEGLHPAVLRLARLIQAQGPPRLIAFERHAPDEFLLEPESAGHKLSVPGWDVLRALGGEVAEVFAYAAPEELLPEEPLLMAGRFEQGGLFQATFLPHHPEPQWRLAVLGRYERLELIFPQGWPGPARLTWSDAAGVAHEETWATWNPWPALVEAFEATLANDKGTRWQCDKVTGWQGDKVTTQAVGKSDKALADHSPCHLVTISPCHLSWQEEVRCLELDDAARRSVERRRASLLEYQDATEEVGFKGTMTLVGCGLLWGGLVLLILSIWIPWLGWGILPLLAVFLALQLLRWAVPPREPATGATDAGPQAQR